MENMTYTQAMARLEEIMALVQNGRMDIDELSGVLKEASSLVHFCRTKLFKVDEEVKTLLDELSSELAD
jgi:exodeoxyribonuclease VII small subunit